SIPADNTEEHNLKPRLGRCAQRPEVSDVPGAGVTGYCELSNMGVGKQTPVLCINGRGDLTALDLQVWPLHRTYQFIGEENVAVGQLTVLV
ncbi:hypothetical protein STEG23_022416, partial [Scotinomys teguina]